MEYNCFTMLLVSSVQQCESAVNIHVSPPSGVFLPAPHLHPTPLGHHRALSWAPYAISNSFPLANYLTHGSVYMSMLVILKMTENIWISTDTAVGPQVILSLSIFICKFFHCYGKKKCYYILRGMRWLQLNFIHHFIEHILP